MSIYNGLLFSNKLSQSFLYIFFYNKIDTINLVLFQTWNIYYK